MARVEGDRALLDYLDFVCSYGLKHIKNPLVKSVFLGKGKVNLAIARIVGGDQVFLDEEGGENFDTIDWARLLPAQIFISPGVDPRRPFFKKIEKFEVRELDLFAKSFPGKLIVVTGTDGKSTFTTQLGEVLKRALPEKKIFVGGNLGNAMFEALSEPYDLAVIEVSSFQAERLKLAKPDIAILTNLAPDHLDRYDKLEDYHRAKWSLLERSKKIFYPTDLKSPLTKKSAASFSNDAGLQEILKQVVEAISKDLHIEYSESLFEDLPTLPHRLETWKDKNGNRTFINDSKATTVHATSYAMKTIGRDFAEIHLILGGKAKGESFRPLLPFLRKTDRLFIVGEARSLIFEHMAAFDGSKSVFMTLEDCLRTSLSEIPFGGCLLLSPACSSYDEFNNFEERGNFFLEKVKERFDIQRLKAS